MDIDLKVEGLAELHKQLEKLDANTGVKVLNTALFAASKPTYDRVRANSSPWPSFRAAIRRRKQRIYNKKKGKSLVQKGYRKGFTGNNRVTGVSIEVVHKKAPHYHLLELGTQERTTKKGARRGRIIPKRMMSRAFEGGAPQEALEIFKKRLRSQLKKLTKAG